MYAEQDSCLAKELANKNEIYSKFCIAHIYVTEPSHRTLKKKEKTFIQGVTHKKNTSVSLG